AIFLVMYLYLAKDLINLIPLSALSAIVVFIGYKLCRPKVWRHVAHVGSEQLLVFCTTVLVTVSTDLLLGIVAGMVLEFVLNVSLAWPAARGALAAATVGNGNGVADARAHSGVLTRFADLFRNPVTNRELVDDDYHMYFDKPLVSFNSLYLTRELMRIPEQATTVHFHMTDGVTLIDHSASTSLMAFVRDYEQSGKRQIHFTGMDEMFKCSHDESCVRLSSTALPGTARGGISAIVAKARGSFLEKRRLAAIKAARRRARRERFIQDDGDDLGFLNLSSSGEYRIADTGDVSRLGPSPNRNASKELDRLSLAFDGSEPPVTDITRI